jgi:flagellar hook protein FlgE
MSYNQGISGLNAAAADLDAIGNNIANASTVGFKQAGVQFKDIFAGSQIGLGVGVASVVQDFSPGPFELTNRPLDLAVANGTGFFRVTAPGSSEVSYTRNGQFNVDKDGYIVNASGMQLTGYAIAANGSLGGGSPQALRMPTTPLPPSATTAVGAEFNLDARGTVPTGGAFSATNPATYNYANSLQAFDSLGNPHELAMYFVKSAATPNTWDVYATCDGAQIGAGAVQSGLQFDPNGKLTVPVGGKITVPAVTLGNGAANLAMTVDLTGSTQFGNPSAVQKLTQDGYTSGVLTSYSVGGDGVVTGKYSNDQNQAIGQIVLSSFANAQGLKSAGDNQWVETSASGQALTGVPGLGSQRGSLTSGALESSNVDMTVQLVALIKGQRNYQANAQTLKTQSEVSQTLLNLR